VARQTGSGERAGGIGDAVAGRYRLERPRGRGAHSQLWRAVDEMLARPVALRVVPLGSGRRCATRETALRAAVGRAGAVADRRFAQILDFDLLPDSVRGADPSGRACFLVSEWVAAPPLAELLADRAFSPAEATDLAWQLADALSAAARYGAGHGRLHPGNVALPERGEIRITDLETARVIAGDPVAGAELAARDVAGIGCLLYAALTGHWPDGTFPGLPAAPQERGRRVPARRLRRGVSRELDEAAERLLRPGAVTDPAGAAALLARLPRARRDTTAPEPEPGVPGRRPVGRLRRWTARVLPVLVGIAVAAGAYTEGVHLGRLPNPNPTARAAPSDAAGAHRAPLTALRALAVSAISVFEPPGHDAEDASGARFAVDGNPATAWYTFRYYGNPVFGGLKPGAGLLVDLGRARSVSRVQVTLVYPGADVTLLASAVAPKALNGLRVVAARKDTPLTFDLDPVAAGQARYWLLWLTRLPPVGSAYQEGVVQLTFFG
jgi:hypothetical protein